ncbi:MAG: hypothetical protein GTN73_07930 [Candidatus Aminicenantes bacterium]|nr:hypothetical protein [Candidatus Aminicenantes bacterium]
MKFINKEEKIRNILKLFIVLILSLVMGLSDGQAQLKCKVTNDPAKVELIYDDLHNFIRAMEMLGKESNPETIFQREYLDKASPGLKEYVSANKYEAKHFVEEIRKKMAQYSGLRDLPKALVAQENAIRKAFKGLTKVIPNTVFMPVYYFVGIRGGGLHAEPSEYGLLIAIAELDEDLPGVKLVLVHETVHVQQALAVGLEEYQSIYGPKMSLLAVSLREGVAQFLTFLSTGERTKEEAYEYFDKNEREVWERFMAEMNEHLPGDWMWTKPKKSEQPRDLGYIIGDRIVEAFYNEAEDKEKAIIDILSITDYQEFFKKSGYAEKFSDK